MSEKKENLFVNLVKKSVGLSTGQSSCCGATPVVETNPPACCSNASKVETDSTEKSQKVEPPSSGCCG